MGEISPDNNLNNHIAHQITATMKHISEVIEPRCGRWMNLPPDDAIKAMLSDIPRGQWFWHYPWMIIGGCVELVGVSGRTFMNAAKESVAKVGKDANNSANVVLEVKVSDTQVQALTVAKSDKKIDPLNGAVFELDLRDAQIQFFKSVINRPDLLISNPDPKRPSVKVTSPHRRCNS